jgi:hypothetical protein
VGIAATDGGSGSEITAESDTTRLYRATHSRRVIGFNVKDTFVAKSHFFHAMTDLPNQCSMKTGCPPFGNFAVTAPPVGVL